MPREPIGKVARDNFIEELRRIWEGSTRVVHLVDEPLTGKTSLCADLVRSDMICIGVFVPTYAELFQTNDYVISPNLRTTQK
jgi:hypothetical protein